MKDRITWPQFFMGVAKLISKRSTCIHYKVGIVFTDRDQLLSLGYNGPPRGEPNCNEVGCAKEVKGNMLPPGSGRCRGSHAEINAITNAVRNGIRLRECTVYCTWSPCYDCAKHLSNAGIVGFVYEKKYKEEFQKVKELFLNQGISLITYRTKLRRFNKAKEQESKGGKNER